MTKMGRVTPLLVLGLLGLVLTGVPRLIQAEIDPPKVINLHPKGPHPKALNIKAGTAVLWVSHLAPTNLVVTTVAFIEGQRAARATTPVEGYNGFDLEGEHFVGRIEGDGGRVALRFVTPGTYTYTIDHRGHLTGTIVVHE